MSFQFVKSLKGRDQLVKDGFSFHRNRQKGEKIFWRCNEYSSLRCTSRCSTHKDVMVKGPTPHNHIPDPIKIQCRSAINQMKEIAITTAKTTKEVISKVSSKFPEAVKRSLPNIRNIKQSIRVARKSNLSAPSSPDNLSDDFQIPDIYQSTLASERFLLYDDHNGPERIIIFVTNVGMDVLKRYSMWYCDGTFKTCPSIFCQLYTIHVNINNGTVPAVYCLLPNKSTTIYNRMWEYIRRNIPNLSPTRIIVDFEKAAISSIQTNFPVVKICGCYFHFSQSVWRHIQGDSDVLNRYKSDCDFNLHVRMIVALAFIPVEDLILAYNLLTADQYYVSNFSDFERMLNYMEDNYIGRWTDAQVRRNPRFPIELWNAYENTLMIRGRTNNAMEGWHNAFGQIVNCSHPSLWKFIECLKIDESYTALSIQQLQDGLTINFKKKKSKETEAAILIRVQQYCLGNLKDYLKFIANKLKFNS